MDEFVKRLVPDPKNPPDTLLLSGFLGTSSEENHTRLYFDMELANYIEIPDDAILHSEPLPTGHGGLGGSYVWIRRDAEVIYGKVIAQRPKGRFFEGPIMQQAARAAFPQSNLGNTCIYPMTEQPSCTVIVGCQQTSPIWNCAAVKTAQQCTLYLNECWEPWMQSRIICPTEYPMCIPEPWQGNQPTGPGQPPGPGPQQAYAGMQRVYAAAPMQVSQGRPPCLSIMALGCRSLQMGYCEPQTMAWRC